jgi:hypothetical protein
MSLVLLCPYVSCMKMCANACYCSVVDPDPDWIRIQWGLCIRIRIRNPDPDQRGQKCPTKIEKVINLIF